MLWFWLVVWCVGLSALKAVAEADTERDGDTSRKILGSSVVTSVSVVMGGGHTYYMDATGQQVSRPSVASALSSPISLLSPDRYEFYTFNDDGELVKRLMTLPEIQSIIAGGGTGDIPDDTHTDVTDVVLNVQNVLKEEMDNTLSSVTADVSHTWNIILPAIFGDTVATPMAYPELKTTQHHHELTTTHQTTENLFPAYTIPESQLPINYSSETIPPHVTHQSFIDMFFLPTKPTPSTVRTKIVTSDDMFSSSTTERYLDVSEKMSTEYHDSFDKITSTTNHYIGVSKPDKVSIINNPIFSATDYSLRDNSVNYIHTSTSSKPMHSTHTATTKPLPIKSTTVKPISIVPSSAQSTTVSSSIQSKLPVRPAVQTSTKRTPDIMLADAPEGVTILDSPEITSTTKYHAVQLINTNTSGITEGPIAAITSTKEAMTNTKQQTESTIPQITKTIPTTMPITEMEGKRNTLPVQKPTTAAITFVTELVPMVTRPATHTTAIRNTFGHSTYAQSTTMASTLSAQKYVNMSDLSTMSTQENINLPIFSTINDTLKTDTNNNSMGTTISNMDDVTSIGNKNDTTEISTISEKNKFINENEDETSPPIVIENYNVENLIQELLNQPSILNKAVTMGSATASATPNQITSTEQLPTTLVNTGGDQLAANSTDTSATSVQSTLSPITTSEMLELKSVNTQSTEGTTERLLLTQTEQDTLPTTLAQDQTNTPIDWTMPTIQKMDMDMDTTTDSMSLTTEQKTLASTTKDDTDATVSSTPEPIITTTDAVKPITRVDLEIKQSENQINLNTEATTESIIATAENMLKNVPSYVISQNKTTSSSKIMEPQKTTQIIAKETTEPTANETTAPSPPPTSTTTNFSEPYRKTDEVQHVTTSVLNKNTTETENNTWKLVETVTKVSSVSEKSKLELYNKPTTKVDLTSQGTFGLPVLSEDMHMFSRMYNELALRFWNALSINDISSDRSVIVSPFGAISLLSMIFLGARGGTSGEMNDVLKLDDIVTFNPHLVFKEVTESVISRSSLSAIVRELYSDNNKGKVHDFYKERVRQFYDGHVEELDFKKISSVIRRRTNSLVNKQTRGQMPQYLEETTLFLRPPLSALSTNIFQVDCAQASTEGRDGELYFIVLPSMRQRRLVPIPAAVWRSDFIAGYDPELDATAVSLGVGGGVGVGGIEVSTVFVIPGQQGHSAPGDVLLRLEARLLNTTYMPDTWTQLLKSMLPRPGLEVQLPRFVHKSVMNITSALKQLGLRELFDVHKANLQGLNGNAHGLFLSDVLQLNEFSVCGDMHQVQHREVYPSLHQHQLDNQMQRHFKYVTNTDTNTNIEPDNTALPLPLRPRQARLPDIPRLRFDRPFLYFVRHNPTGLILHIGRFNPSLVT